MRRVGGRCAQRRRRMRRVGVPRLDPRQIGQSVADALAQVIQPLAGKMMDQAVPATTAPAPEPVAYLSSEQRHTKPLANYESYVYGFGLSVPVKMAPGDDIEKEETRDRFREKYQTIVNFLLGIMREVEAEIEAMRGVSS